MPSQNVDVRQLVRDYLWSIAFWLAVALLIAWQMYRLERQMHVPVLLKTMLLVHGARYLTVAILTPPVFYLVARWPVSGAVIRRVAAYALGYIPFSLAFAAIRWSLLPPWMDETQRWGPRTLQTLLWLASDTFADILLLYLGVVVAAHAYTYFIRGQRQEIEGLELRQSLAQSELQALRAQLHPHFLFNTLQGVSTLIDTDPLTAQGMLRALAALLRTVLSHGSADVITLREELAVVESYLNVEKMRLGDRLRVRWRVEPGACDALIPQLLLQPLVENAVVHGIANSRDGGWIELGAGVRDGRLRVVIRNSVGGHSQPGLGVGMKNTRARLKFLYSDDASFEFHAASGLAEASLALPAFTTLTGNDAALRAT
ncbi:MAG TPA: histidine kinase [Steroidobacteraceae bacterium]|jgi:hypothetical protein|nr:histidine kinase [Steroidobacteraceae bacterium]